MKPVFVQEPARADLSEADEWYETRPAGLGDALLAEFERTARLIAERPGMFPKVEGDARRALLRGFPYQIIYLDEMKSIVIVAVLHSHRDPKVWKVRLGTA